MGKGHGCGMVGLRPIQRRTGQGVSGVLAVLKGIGLMVIGVTGVAAQACGDPPPLTPEASLGRELFFDTSLSNPAGQSCASCHAPSAGFTFPDSHVNDR